MVILVTVNILKHEVPFLWPRRCVNLRETDVRGLLMIYFLWSGVGPIGSCKSNNPHLIHPTGAFGLVSVRCLNHFQSWPSQTSHTRWLASFHVLYRTLLLITWHFMPFTTYTRSGDRSLESRPLMFNWTREGILLFFHGGLPLNAAFESGIQIQSSERKMCASLTFRWRSYFPTIHESKGERCMFKCPFTTLLAVASPAKKIPRFCGGSHLYEVRFPMIRVSLCQSLPRCIL